VKDLTAAVDAAVFLSGDNILINKYYIFAATIFKQVK